MARMQGVEPSEAGLLTRVVYAMVRRKVAKLAGQSRLVEPVKIAAHHPRLLRAVGQMEMAQDAAATVPAALKTLASIKAAMVIGCPY